MVSGRRLRVGLVTEPTGIENPYINGAYLGLERAVRESGIRGRVLTPAPKEGHVPSLSLLARQKYDLVIGFGFYAGPAIDRVAAEFPDTRFASIDFAHDDLPHRPTNVVGLVFREEEAGYLAGHLAARVLTLFSRRGGDQLRRRRARGAGGRAVHRRLPGRREGRQSSHHDVEQLYGQLPRPGKGQVGRPEPDREGPSSRVPGREHVWTRALEAAGERGVWGIGVDVDQSHLGPHILTSAVKRLDVAVFDTIEELARGTLETGRTSRFSLENSGVGLGPISAGVPRSLAAEIDDVRAGIVGGEIPITSSST
jgi:basic membrane protein A and related proteins